MDNSSGRRQAWRAPPPLKRIPILLASEVSHATAWRKLCRRSQSLPHSILRARSHQSVEENACQQEP